MGAEVLVTSHSRWLSMLLGSGSFGVLRLGLNKRPT